jgi:hypothetical protein
MTLCLGHRIDDIAHLDDVSAIDYVISSMERRASFTSIAIGDTFAADDVISHT